MVSIIQSVGPNKSASKELGARMRKATTLMELMIALVVLGGIVTTAILAMSQGFFATEYSRNLNRVSQILQTEMETIRTYSWAEIVALNPNTTFDPFNGTTTVKMRNLVCKRIITTEKTNQKRIRLVVTWTDSRAISHQRSYESLYTKEGLSDYYSRIL